LAPDSLIGAQGSADARARTNQISGDPARQARGSSAFSHRMQSIPAES
jgi:hypothetical protein